MKEDIERGRPGDARHCAWALAANRSIPKVYFSLITHDVLKCYMGHGKYIEYPVPHEIAESMAAFDTEGTTKPMTWELELK